MNNLAATFLEDDLSGLDPKQRIPAAGALVTGAVARYSFSEMTGAISDLVQGAIAIWAGIAILLNLDFVADFDQRWGVKVNAWLKRLLGNSFLTRDIYSVGTPSGLRKSRICLRIAAIVLILSGLGLATMSARLLLLLDHLSRRGN